MLAACFYYFVLYKSVGRFNIHYFAYKFQDKDGVSNYSIISLIPFLWLPLSMNLIAEDYKNVVVFTTFL